MPMFCAVYGCSNRSNRETTRSFYRVPKIVVHKGERCKKLTEKRRKQWLENLRLLSKGAESNNARVCSDHFVKGCPSALNDVESVDWAPTVKLGYQKGKPMSQVSLKREKKMKSREDQHAEGAQALLDLHWSNRNLKQEDDTEMLHGRQDAGCQTDLTMDDMERMKDVLKQTTTGPADLESKDTQFSQESLQKNKELYIGLPVFLVVKSM